MVNVFYVFITANNWFRCKALIINLIIAYPRRVDVRQAAGRKIIAESLSQHDVKHVVPIPLSGIRVGK
jgi:hypothetical protein